MKKFEGKKLLVLGSNTYAKEIVLYAKENGAHTIVLDWLNPANSSAKSVADESFLVSTTDTSEICRLINEEHVDGVISGISEFNFRQVLKVSEQMGLPCYCSIAQWDMVENKGLFRNLCDAHQVPTPLTYYIGDGGDVPWGRLCYPLVVKPVDASASSGVHICQTEEDLNLSIADALEHSSLGKVILEQFFEGEEFTAHYVVYKGEAMLVCMDDRYPVAVHEGNVTTIPAARIYPSTFLDSYRAQVDPAMKELIESLDLTYAVMFVQGLYNKEKDEFALFEAGLRSAGEAPNRIIKKLTGQDYMKILVDVALGVTPTYDPTKCDPLFQGKCCGVVSYVGRGGVVGSIVGLEDLTQRASDVICCEKRYGVGSEVPDGDTLRQLVLRFVMVCECRRDMVDDIKYLNNNIDVFDVDGNSMVHKFNPERLLGRDGLRGERI